MSWTPLQHALFRRTAFALLLAGVAAHRLAELVEPRLGLSPYYPYWVTLPFAIAAAVALAGVTRHHPHPRFGPANGVTSLRLVLTSLIVGLTTEASSDGPAALAAALALLATALDGLDGWLARRTGMASPFGARYDMETDALLIMALALMAWEEDKAGGWVVLTGAMRYLFILAGRVWAWMRAPLPPSQRRKAVCVVQIVGLGLIVSPLMVPPVSVVAAAFTLILLTWSFGVDVLWLHRHARNVAHV